MPLYRLHFRVNQPERVFEDHSDENHLSQEEAERQAEFYAWELIKDDEDPDPDSIFSWAEPLEY